MPAVQQVSFCLFVLDWATGYDGKILLEAQEHCELMNRLYDY